MCISQITHGFIHPDSLVPFFAGAYSIIHKPPCLTLTILAYIFPIVLLSVSPTEFSEEFHLAKRTPEKALNKLEGSGLSNS